MTGFWFSDHFIQCQQPAGGLKRIMDTAIKQRILGGVVLLAGAAIFLPLMLDGTGARLLSRLEPIPAHPPAPVAEKAQPALDAQAQSAEQAVDEAHEDSTAFYPVGEPQPVDGAGLPAAEMPPAGLAKTPEQLAAEEAARKRANDLLNSSDEISPEEAAQQQRSAEKLAREMASHAEAGAVAPVASIAAAADKKADEERARAILEARNLADQKAADQRAAEEKAVHAREQKLAMEKAAADKARLTADKALAEKKAPDDKLKAEKLAADKKLADEKAKAEKLRAEKLAAEEKAKVDKLAAEKAKKLEEQKAKVALEGKAKADEKTKADEKADSKPVGGSQAWVVQAGSFSDKAKAAELSSKLKGKGFRAQVVKNGDAWKVVVGPELDKGAAKALSGRLSGEAGISGAWVAPWKP
ncbi:MAG TPA: SPOR domain-containing protein [Fluviicoccus sp.]|nr:SPOR domain-containing protein [Fluviicoccus sp.]